MSAISSTRSPRSRLDGRELSHGNSRCRLAGSCDCLGPHVPATAHGGHPGREMRGRAARWLSPGHRGSDGIDPRARADRPEIAGPCDAARGDGRVRDGAACGHTRRPRATAHNCARQDRRRGRRRATDRRAARDVRDRIAGPPGDLLEGRANHAILLAGSRVAAHRSHHRSRAGNLVRRSGRLLAESRGTTGRLAMRAFAILALAAAAGCADKAYDPTAPAIDPNAPRVHITRPARGSIAGGVPMVTVTGTETDDTAVASVTVNDIPTTLAADGTWTT